MTVSYISFTLKMESVTKSTILEDSYFYYWICDFGHFYEVMETIFPHGGISKIFYRPLFTIIFRPKIVRIFGYRFLYEGKNGVWISQLRHLKSNFKISLVPLCRAQKLPDEKRSQCQNTITRTVISREQPFVLKNGWVVILLSSFIWMYIAIFLSDNDIYVLSTLSKAP